MPFLQQGNSAVVTIPAGQSIAIGAPVDSTANLMVPIGQPGGPSATVTGVTSQVFGPYPSGTTATVVSAKGQIEYVVGVVPAAGVSSSISTGVSSSADAYRLWRKSLAGVVSGTTANPKILLIGDSFVNSSGADGAGYTANGRPKSLGPRIASALRNKGIQAQANGVFGAGNIPSWHVFDTRFTLATEWQTPAAVTSGIGSGFMRCNTGVSPLATFAPTPNVDTFVFHYYQFTGQGNFSWRVDAGGFTAVNASTTPEQVTALTIPAGSVGVHTLGIQRNSGNVFAVGWRAYNSSNNEIEIIQAGSSGSTASQFLLATLPYQLIPMIGSIAPNLTIVHWGTNEANAGQSLTTYVSSMTTIIQAAQAVGSVLIVTQTPRAISAVPLDVQKTYADAAVSLAAALGCDVLNQFARVTSYEVYNPLGYYADTIHLNGDVGYADLAGAIVSRIVL